MSFVTCAHMQFYHLEVHVWVEHCARLQPHDGWGHRVGLGHRHRDGEPAGVASYGGTKDAYMKWSVRLDRVKRRLSSKYIYHVVYYTPVSLERGVRGAEHRAAPRPQIALNSRNK
jgi:hypothetical protein